MDSTSVKDSLLPTLNALAGPLRLVLYDLGCPATKKKRKGGEREMVYSAQLVSQRSLYSDFQCVQNYLCGRSELQGAGHAVRCDEKKASFAHTVIANGNK